MAHDLKKEIKALPNLLTFLRVLLIPAVLWFIDNESPLRSFIAGLLYSASAMTDFVDGYLARKWGQVSLLGKFLDPLADKILVMATLVWMVPMGRIDAWLVVVLLARELSITALRSVASSEGLVIAARQLGKRKTALQMAGILCLIIHFRYPVAFTGFVVDFHQVGLYTLYISLVFSLFSAVEYVQLFVRAVHGSSRDEGPAASASAEQPAARDGAETGDEGDGPSRASAPSPTADAALPASGSGGLTSGAGAGR